MGKQVKLGQSNTVDLPEEVTLGAGDPEAADVLLRTDSGVLMHCARTALPAGVAAGARLVVETAVYMTPLKKWRVGRVRLPGAPVATPASAAEQFWAATVGPLDSPEAVLTALTAVTEAQAALQGHGMAGGRVLLPDEKEAFLGVGKARVAEVVRRAAEVAPTLALRRLKGPAREEWKEVFEERARRVPPELSGAAPALVHALSRVRERIERDAGGGAWMAAPASPHERARHHARIPPPAQARELLGLSNGFVLFGGAIRLHGIFDGGIDLRGIDAGKHAGEIDVLFAKSADDVTTFRLACAGDGRLVTRKLVKRPSGDDEWQEAPSSAAAADLASFLTALATLDLSGLRGLFPADAPPWQAPAEPADLAAIERVDAPEARLRALGEARAAAGDPWGAWVLAQLAGKVAPSEAELRAIAGELEPAFRRARHDAAPALVVEFRRGFAWRVEARSTFDFHARHVLRELGARPWGRRFEHLVVDLLNMSHPHRFGELWELIEQAGLPPCFRSLVAGKEGAEHFLPARLPAMAELTLIGSHFELPDGTDLGSLRRLTLDGAVRFGDFESARWPAPESLTLRAPDELDDEAVESVVQSMRRLLAADFVAELPRLRLEQWGAEGARKLSGTFEKSALRRVELWRCAPELEAAMRGSLGGRVTVVPES